MTNIKGISIEIGGNTEPLQKALRAVDSETKKVQSELKQVNGLLKFDPSNTELLAQKQQLLGKAIENTSSRLDALKQAQSQVEQQFKNGEIGEEAYRKFQREIVATEGKLKAFKQQAENVQAKLDVKADTSGIDKMKSAIEELPNVASTAAKGAAIGIAGIGTAAAGAVVGLTAFVESQKEMSMDMARLSTNAEQAGLSMDKVNEAFTKVSAVSGEADSAVEAVSNLLATGMSENQLAEALDYVNGAAIKFSDTLKTEGIADGLQETFATGKAIGPFAELLERSGVNLETFDAGLAKAKASGEGMNYILDQMSKLGLKETYDGYMQNNSAIAEYNLAQAESQRKLAELSDKLRPLVTDFMDFGNTLLDVGLGNKSLGEAFEELSSKASSAFPEIAEQGMEMFSSLVEGVDETAPELIAFIQDNIPKMVDEIGEILPEFLDAGIDIVTSILEGLAEMLPDLAAQGVELISSLLESIVSKLPDLLDSGVEIVSSLIEGISQKLPEIVSTAVELILKLATTILQNLPKIISAGAEILGALIKGIISLAGNLGIAIVTNIIPQIWKTITGTDWASLGGDIVKGLAKGITNMAKSAIEAITGVVNSVVNKAKSLLDINSPSKVFETIGKWTGEGLAIGIRDQVKNVEGATSELANAMIGAIESQSGEIQKIEKEQASKLAEIEKNKADKIKEIQLKANESKKKLTAAQVRQIAKIEEDAAKKSLEAEQKYAEQIAKAREGLEAEKLNAVKNFIDQKSKLEQLSIVEEAQLWEQSLHAFQENSDAKVEAQIQYRDALNKVYDEITKVNETYSSKVTKINDDLAKEEKALTDAYTKAVDDRAKSLVNFTSLFEEFDAAIETSGSDLLKNLQSQVDGFKTWQEEVEKLSTRAIDEGLLAELREMGPEALGELQALNSLSDDELTKYSNLYQEKMALAKEQSVKELEGLNQETTAKIEELRSNANTELDKLAKDWDASIKSLVTITRNEGKNLETVGQDIVQGLISGMSGMQVSLEDKVRKIAQSIEDTTRKTLQTRSPSKVTTKIGRDVANGLIVGMEQRGEAVTAEARELADSITKAFEKGTFVSEAAFDKLSASSQIKETAKLYNELLTLDIQTSVERERILEESNNKRLQIEDKYSKIFAALEQKRQEAHSKADSGSNDFSQYSSIDNSFDIAKSERLAEYNISLKKVSDEEQKQMQNFNEMLTRRFEKQKEFAEKSKQLNLISLADEKKLYDDFAALYAKDSEQYQYFNDKSVAIVQQANDKIIQLTSQYENAVNSKAQSLYNFASIFDEISFASEITGQQLLENLASQVVGLEEWSRSMQELAKRGVEEGLLAELEALGPKATAELQALLSLTDTELSAYNDLWLQKSQVARQIAEAELIGMKEDTEKQIAELRKITESELSQYNDVWDSNTNEVNEVVSDNLNLNDVGATAVDTLIDGLNSKQSDLISTAQNLAQTVTSTMKEALDINSPSGEGIEIGEFFGQGVEVGLQDSASNVSKAGKQLANDVKESVRANLFSKKEQQDISKSVGNALGSSSSSSSSITDPYKARFDAEKAEIDRLKKYKQLSLYDELKMYEEYMEKYAKGSEQRIEYEDKIAETKDKINEKLLSLNDDYINKIQEANKAFSEKEIELTRELAERKAEIQERVAQEEFDINEEYSNKIFELKEDALQQEKELWDEYAEAVKSREQSIYNSFGLFDQVKVSKIAGSRLIKNLETQTKALEGWKNDLANLEGRGIDKGLLEELQALGPDAAGEIKGLTRLSDKELSQYASLWKEKNELARTQANKEMQGMKADTARRVEELRSATANQLSVYQSEWSSALITVRANATNELALLHSEHNVSMETLRTDTAAQLALYEQEWASSISEIRNGTKGQLNAMVEEMPAIGENIIKGMQDGLTNMTPGLLSQAQSIANSIKSTIQSALDMSATVEKVTQTTQRLSDAANNALGSLASSSTRSQAFGTSSSSTSVDNSKTFAPSVVIHTTDSGAQEMERTLRKLQFGF